MSLLLRSARSAARVSSARSFATTSIFRASEGYGDGAKNTQTEASEATRKMEHPGPESPASKGSPGQKKPEDASAHSGGSRSKDAVEKGSSPTGGDLKKN